jgi:RNA polymerase II subunit A-like phosphatase
MIIQLPKSVAFPVTVGQLLKQQGDDVPRLSPLLTYTFLSKTTEIPEFGTEVVVERTLYGQFDAPVEGRLERWLVAPGTVIESNRYVWGVSSGGLRAWANRFAG